MIICLGPCCIDLTLFLPFLLFLIKPIFNFFKNILGIKNDNDDNIKNNKTNEDVPTLILKDKEIDSLRHRTQITANKNGIHEINSEDMFNELLLKSKNEKKCLVTYYTAKWCKPCKKLTPIYIEYAEKYKNTGIFGKIDVNEGSELSVENGVTLVPTFIFYKNGEQITRINGSFQNSIKTAIERYCADEL